MLCFVQVLRECVCSSPVYAITEMMDMGLYDVPLSMSAFGMGTMLANFHMCCIMLLLRSKRVYVF